MIGETGENAGKLWHYLNEHGETPVTSLAKSTSLRPKDVDRALGWLAREGKIRVEKTKNREVACVEQ